MSSWKVKCPNWHVPGPGTVRGRGIIRATLCRPVPTAPQGYHFGLAQQEFSQTDHASLSHLVWSRENVQLVKLASLPAVFPPEWKCCHWVFPSCGALFPGQSHQLPLWVCLKLCCFLNKTVQSKRGVKRTKSWMLKHDIEQPPRNSSLPSQNVWSKICQFSSLTRRAEDQPDNLTQPNVPPCKCHKSGQILMEQSNSTKRQHSYRWKKLLNFHH